ncbi:RNA-directed DNA polymerase, eukaryota [Artemisia annua]|uniref:RNA-directed DNA polymerase, eukaryota n=1 Tax=Artemisia annua TaxID=35608 RepID=A0A2U1N9C2_ARTAN|nr:RNA-directed DNA polymerase, eukaryota [Artemisia annua]
MEGLHATICKAVNTGMFIGVSIGQGEWSHSNTYNLICMLRCFYMVFGLRINVHKSKLLSVSVPDVYVFDMAKFLGCGVSKLPMTYLGVRVGFDMGRCENWKRIFQKFNSKLAQWKVRLLFVGIGSGRIIQSSQSPWNAIMRSVHQLQSMELICYLLVIVLLKIGTLSGFGTKVVWG